MTSSPTLTPPPPPPEAPRDRLRGLGPWVLLGPPGLWLLVLLVLPVLAIFQLSLVPDIKPGDLVNPSGLGNYFKALEPLNLIIWGRTIGFALASTVVCLLLGFPVAYWLAQMAPKRWQNLLLVAFTLPLWTSSLLRSYAWITILRPTGVLNSLLGWLGISPLDLLNQDSAAVIGMAYSFLPYMVLILYSSLEKLDRRLLEAAADLGATPLEGFFKVTVPQSIQGIAAGSLLVFITSLGDFINPELLGGAVSMTVSRLIYNQFLGATQNWGLGSALSMLTIAAVSLAIALLIRYGDSDLKRT